MSRSFDVRMLRNTQAKIDCPDGCDVRLVCPVCGACDVVERKSILLFKKFCTREFFCVVAPFAPPFIIEVISHRMSPNNIIVNITLGITSNNFSPSLNFVPHFSKGPDGLTFKVDDTTASTHHSPSIDNTCLAEIPAPPS